MAVWIKNKTTNKQTLGNLSEEEWEMAQGKTLVWWEQLNLTGPKNTKKQSQGKTTNKPTIKGLDKGCYISQQQQ